MPFFERDGSSGGCKRSAPFKKGKQKCLVCGRTEDWKCRVREDGLLGLCTYVANDDGRTDREGRYIHNMSQATQRYTPTAAVQERKDTEIPVSQKRDAEYLHQVYKTFLRALDLEERHTENLLSRNLGLADIASEDYKSVPE